VEFIRRGRDIARGLAHRGRALLFVVVAGAMIATIAPFVAGTAQAATARPASQAVAASRAVTPGCKVQSGHPAGSAAADSAEQGLLRALRASGVTAQERTDGGTTVTTYDIAGTTGVGPSATSAWYTYITDKVTVCSDISEWYFDYSANLNQEMVKIAAKHITKISVYLNVLAAALSVILSKSKVGDIIWVISAVLGVAGISLVKWYQIIRKYWAGNGKHTGWYAHQQEDILGIQYVGDVARKCATGWSNLNCGSPAHLYPHDEV
jgi:hypothetical protein